MAGTFGTGIKAVQRGVVTLDSNPDTVAITAVVMAKSFLIVSCSSSASGADRLVQATLTNTTTITFTQQTTGASLVDWQVVEYY